MHLYHFLCIFVKYVLLLRVVLFSSVKYETLTAACVTHSGGEMVTCMLLWK